MARSVPPPGGAYPRPPEEEPNEPQGKKRRIPRIVVPGLAAAAAAPTLGLVPAAAQEATAVPHLDPAPATPPINPASQPRVSVEAVRPTVEVRPVASTSSAEAAERANLLSFPAHITLANQSPLQGYYSSLELGSISSLGREGEFDVPLERLGGVATDSQLADYQSVYGHDNVIVNEDGGITFRAEVMPVRLKAGLGIIETLGLPDSVGMALAEMVGFSSPGTDTQMDGVYGMPVPVGTVEAYIQSQSNEQPATTRPANQTETRNQQNNQTRQRQPQNAESTPSQSSSEVFIPAGLEHELQPGNLTQEAVQVNQHIADVRTRLTSANERGDIDLPDDSELAELNNNILSVIASGDINPREAEAYTVASIIRYNGRNITPDSLRDYAKIMVEDFEVTFEDYSQPGTTTSMNPLISPEVRDLLRNSLAAGWEQILLPDEAKSSNSHNLLVFSNMSILESRLAEAIERREDGQPLEAALLHSVEFYTGDESDFMPRIVQGMYRNRDIPRDVLDQELLSANPGLTPEMLDRPLPVGSTFFVPFGNPDSGRSYEDAIPRPNFSPEYTKNNPEIVSRVNTMFRIMMYYRSQSDLAPQLGNIPILEKQALVKMARAPGFISSGGQLDVERFTDRILNIVGISRDEAVHVHEDLMRRIFNQAQEAGKLRLPDFVKPVVLAELAADRGLTANMADRLVSRGRSTWIDLAFSDQKEHGQEVSDRERARQLFMGVLHQEYGFANYLQDQNLLTLNNIQKWVQILQDGRTANGTNITNTWDIYHLMAQGMVRSGSLEGVDTIEKALAYPVRIYINRQIGDGQIKADKLSDRTINEDGRLSAAAINALGRLINEYDATPKGIIQRMERLVEQKDWARLDALIWRAEALDKKAAAAAERAALLAANQEVNLDPDLLLPPNLGRINDEGKYMFPKPHQPGLYAFDPGAPEESRCGNIELISVIYTAIVEFNKLHPEILIEIGDLDEADGHVSHNYGLDADLDALNDAIMDLGGNQELTLEFAKILASVGGGNYIEVIGYEDVGVIDAFNAWAEENGIDARMEWWDNHHNHFHIRIKGDRNVAASAQCSFNWVENSAPSEGAGNESRGREGQVRGFSEEREFGGASYTAPTSGEGRVVTASGEIFRYPVLPQYDKGSEELKQLIRAGAALMGYPVVWAESDSLHKLLDHESAGGWVGIPNYTYDNLPEYGGVDMSDHPEVWPQVWEDIRDGVFPARSSATGLGQLLASTYENVQAHYPSGVEGVGVPIEEIAGMLSYIEGRYDNPEIAWDNHSANENRYSMGDVRYPEEYEGY